MQPLPMSVVTKIVSLSSTKTTQRSAISGSEFIEGVTVLGLGAYMLGLFWVLSLGFGLSPLDSFQGSVSHIMGSGVVLRLWALRLT